MQISLLRAYAEVILVYGLTFGLAAVAALAAWVRPASVLQPPTPTLANQLAGQAFGWGWQVVVCLGIALMLARRRDVGFRSLGLRVGRETPESRRQAIAVAVIMIVSMYTASLVLTSLAPNASYPLGATGPWGMIGAVGSSLQAGVVEEFVVVAFTITTLRQARRPWAEVIAVAYTLRLAYHLYYGSWWVLVWVAIWGGAAIGLYIVTRRHVASEVLFDLDAQARAAAAIDPLLVLDGPTPRLLDEWQREPGLWDGVRRTVDDRRLPGQFVLTGSARPTDDVPRHSGAGRFAVVRMRPA